MIAYFCVSTALVRYAVKMADGPLYCSQETRPVGQTCVGCSYITHDKSSTRCMLAAEGFHIQSLYLVSTTQASAIVCNG